MMLKRFGRISCAAILLSVALLSPGRASAQTQPNQPTTLRPPTPGKEDQSRPLVMTIVAGIIIVAAVMGANMIPAKRGHQD